MKVRAIDVGYYDHALRKKGEVFELQEGEDLFSSKWMERVDGHAPAPKAKAKAKESKDSSGNADVI